MKKHVIITAILGFCGAFSASAVELKCGTFHWAAVEPTRVPVIAFKTVVLDNGEIFVAKAPFVGVTEEATDVISGLNDGDEVCYKANSVFMSGHRAFYVFSVAKK